MTRVRTGLNADVTKQLTAGFTSSINVIGTGAAYTIDFKLQGLGTWTPGAAITINEPTTSAEYGSQMILITPTADVPSITYGGDVLAGVDNPTSLTSGVSYLMMVARFSDTQTVVLISEVA